MSVTDMLRAVKETMGERGEFSLPLIPQLVPQLTIGTLEQLGSPPFVPFAVTFEQGAVVGQRGIIEIIADPGYIVVIESAVTSGDARVGITSGGPLAAVNNGAYALDLRRWPRNAVAILRFTRSGAETNATISARYTNVFSLFAEVGRELRGPVFVAGISTALAIWGNADNVAFNLHLRGRLLLAE